MTEENKNSIYSQTFWQNELLNSSIFETQSKLEVLSVEQVESLKFSAQDLGASDDWIAGILQTYGPSALASAIEFLRNGASPTFIWSTLQLFGPAFLGFLIDLYNESRKKAIVQLDDGKFENQKVGSLSLAIITLILVKVMPILIEKYGPQILNSLLALFMNIFSEESKAENFDVASGKYGDSEKFKGFTSELVELVATKVMPIIFEKYGSDILNTINNALINAAKGESSKGGGNLSVEL
jgi:hypothetical protein